MSLANKLLSSLGLSTPTDPADAAADTDDGPDAVLARFISKSPASTYTFDSARRDAPQSELCRAPEGARQQKECITIQMQSRRLFQAMQDQGFFCALPIDPKQTHIECTPKPRPAP
ncbi:hypothetical protein DFH11DRAFT_379924 [Phellopilus nigrolimitatus]|nr:hypothetical protein DFH11DRAFT_379924 [Phellopilus nigrolimitatus]